MNPLSLFQNLTPKGKLALAGSAIGVLVVAVLLMRLATQPSYTTVQTGLDPAETGKLTAALDEKGIGYKLENNGTALAVDSAQTAAARIALAEQGLPKKGEPGFELFDKQKLGTSDFQQKVNYQRALEGEIAGTIEQVDGVSDARVDLVLPDEQLFEEEESPAKAAVLLTTDSGVDGGAVRGIAQLVASGVKGLKLENVSITDQNGTLLWPNGDGGGAGATSKQTAERRYSQEAEGELNALLTQTLGPGKGQVRVKADLNVDEATKEELAYANKGVPLKTHTEEETLQGGGGGGGGAGAGANIPSYGGAAGGGGNSNYERKTEDTDLGVGKTVTRTKVAPGQVNKLDVAVVVDKAVPPATVQELETALRTAAGIDAERGDTITVNQVEFAKAPAAQKPGMASGAMGYAKYVALGIGMLLFLFFMTRHLKKREDESLGEPTWLRELEQPVTLAELEQGQMPAEQIPQNAVRSTVEDFASREPERVADQVRAWVHEGSEA